MPPTGPVRPVEILLVEDNPDDADLMKEALEQTDLCPRVTVLEDGAEAVEYLFRRDPYRGVPRPDLILLDLHLPRKNGHQVLAEIKRDEALRRIPVIVMTSLSGDRPFLDAYDLHANCCVPKPSDLDQFIEVVKKIERFWLQVASTRRVE